MDLGEYNEKKFKQIITAVVTQFEYLYTLQVQVSVDLRDISTI